MAKLGKYVGVVGLFLLGMSLGEELAPGIPWWLATILLVFGLVALASSTEKKANK
jgi:hypothetical protein